MSFKEFNQHSDISSQISSVNEIVALTGTLFSGGAESYTRSYVNITSGSAVSGGFFQTVYDGAPTSTSASALVDFTYGCSTGSAQYARSEMFLKNEKNRVYKQMAKYLLGNEDSLFSFNSTTYHDLFFVLPKRRIFKDEIKKGSISILIQTTGTIAQFNVDKIALIDTNAANSYIVGPAGDEGRLYSGSTEVGKVYYNAGIIAFHTGVFLAQGAPSAMSVLWSGSAQTLNRTTISGNFDNINYGLKNRIDQLTFTNQTNLHSTIYFCRALNADFNYSTNPTFIDADGRIIPTSGSDNQTRSYITTVGLYDINDNLLAVAKASEPIKKSPDNELIFRVKLSY